MTAPLNKPLVNSESLLLNAAERYIKEQIPNPGTFWGLVQIDLKDGKPSLIRVERTVIPAKL